jgi:hypothetical protein
VPVTGTDVRRTAKAAANALEAFERAQDVIVEVARSTAGMIEKAVARAARPDRVEVESASPAGLSAGSHCRCRNWLCRNGMPIGLANTKLSSPGWAKQPRCH